MSDATDALREYIRLHGVHVEVTIPFGGTDAPKVPQIDWQKFVSIGKEAVGKTYVFGVEVDPNQTDMSKIDAFDCSELVEYLYARVGIKVPDGSYNQANVCVKVQGPLSIGDLGFKANPENGVVHHVGIYIGDNQVLEAKGAAWGVVLTPMHTFMSSSHFSFWGRLKQLIQNA